jgi:hypothetical protein
MNHKAIHKAYSNYDSILYQTTTTEPWQPFDIQSEITSAPGNTNTNPYHIQRTKRLRTHKRRDQQTTYQLEYPSTEFAQTIQQKQAVPLQRPATAAWQNQPLPHQI